MLKIDFLDLKRIAQNATTIKGNGDIECVNGALRVCYNISETLMSMNADECAMAIMSLQNWVIRRTYTQSNETVNAGDIFFADLGIVNNPEFGYPHPVLIIGKIGDLYLVTPVSSSPNVVGKSYHPEENPDGAKYAIKVTCRDGFECDSSILLNNLRTISGGRLISKKGHISSNDTFDIVTNLLFQNIFPEQYKEIASTKSRCDEVYTD